LGLRLQGSRKRVKQRSCVLIRSSKIHDKVFEIFIKTSSSPSVLPFNQQIIVGIDQDVEDIPLVLLDIWWWHVRILLRRKNI
jgi:hypothetical protein